MLERQERKLPSPESSPRARRTHGALWLLRALERSDTPDDARGSLDAFLRARIRSGIAYARWPVVQVSADVRSTLFPYAAEAQRWRQTVKEIAAGE